MASRLPLGHSTEQTPEPPLHRHRSQWYLSLSQSVAELPRHPDPAAVAELTAELKSGRAWFQRHGSRSLDSIQSAQALALRVSDAVQRAGSLAAVGPLSPTKIASLLHERPPQAVAKPDPAV
ncbi:MAG: hypothetical protein EBZ48_01260 [Proteobacteria bacterium]|nr:hypothetical protein [Pseudomonadota bacterium]